MICRMVAYLVFSIYIYTHIDIRLLYWVSRVGGVEGACIKPPIRTYPAIKVGVVSTQQTSSDFPGKQTGSSTSNGMANKLGGKKRIYGNRFLL